ncbi:MAG TPA: hypothetical protein VFN48_09810 [Solirubrobacteraceae bacterium]|nr:hypothetical protein [Solirubrobacteraceae bacterium]
MAEILVVVDVTDPSNPPTRLEIAPKAMQLRELGMTHRMIAEALSVSEKTVARAIGDAVLAGTHANAASVLLGILGPHLDGSAPERREARQGGPLEAAQRERHQ